ncbi:hypothetical protein EIP86_009993 [Pleurotus ostreatoroseus]|nr:hypothetical protein EIP86_009993 [Pleurotus ostreatoroseus]
MLPRVCPSDLLVSAVRGPRPTCIESRLGTPGRCTAPGDDPTHRGSSASLSRKRQAGEQAFGRRLASLCFVVCHHDVRSAWPNTPSTDTKQHGQGGVVKGRPCKRWPTFCPKAPLRPKSNTHRQIKTDENPVLDYRHPVTAVTADGTYSSLMTIFTLTSLPPIPQHHQSSSPPPHGVPSLLGVVGGRLIALSQYSVCQGSQPDCPTCRKPLNLPPASIWDHVPKELRSFFHPVIRRVYLNGVIVDPDEQTSMEEELQELREKADSLESEHNSAQATIRALRQHITNEQMKVQELRRDLNASLQREMAATAEVQQYKQGMGCERGLQGVSGSGSAPCAVAGTCTSNYRLEFHRCWVIPLTDTPFFTLILQLLFPATLQAALLILYRTARIRFKHDTERAHATECGFKPPVLTPAPGPSSSAVPSPPVAYHYSNSLSTDPRLTEPSHGFGDLLPPLPSPSGPSPSSQTLTYAPAYIQHPCYSQSQHQAPTASTSASTPGGPSTYPHPSLAPPRDWSHAQREKRAEGARTQSYQHLYHRRLLSPMSAPFAAAAAASASASAASSSAAQRRPALPPLAPPTAHGQPFVYSPAQVQVMGQPGAPPVSVSYPSF